MHIIINTHIQERRGKPAIWLEGKRLANAFLPNELYRKHLDIANGRLRLIKVTEDTDADGRVSVRNPRKGTVGEPKPLLELRDEDLLKVFWVGCKLRIIVSKHGIEVTLHSGEVQRKERAERMQSKLASGETLVCGSQYTGAGILDNAIHQGLKLSGFDSYLKVAVESEPTYVDVFLRNQSELLRDDSIIINSSDRDIDYKGECKLDVFVAGIPCTAASKAGKSKKKLSIAEDDESAGDCFFHTLNFVKQTQPWLVIFENVMDYASTASFAVISSVMAGWGYRMSQSCINGNEMGALENRDRLSVVFITDVDHVDMTFDFSLVVPLRQKETSIAEVLVSLPEESEEWKLYEYLALKESRDKADNKGFKRSMYNGNESSVTTIRRLYHKGGSCDQYLQSPYSIEHSRLFLPIEHAKLKTIPFNFVEGVCRTTQHELLGQSVIYCAFIALAKAIGQFIRVQTSFLLQSQKSQVAA